MENALPSRGDDFAPTTVAVAPAPANVTAWAFALSSSKLEVPLCECGAVSEPDYGGSGWKMNGAEPKAPRRLPFCHWAQALVNTEGWPPPFGLLAVRQVAQLSLLGDADHIMLA